jgi:hypothetical protein
VVSGVPVLIAETECSPACSDAVVLAIVGLMVFK